MYYLTYRDQEAVGSGWLNRRALCSTTSLHVRNTVGSPCERHTWTSTSEHVDIHVKGEVGKVEPRLEAAIRFNEVCGIGGEFELLANGRRGLTAISGGDIDNGLRRLDATTTAVVTDESIDPETIGWTGYLLDACDAVRAFGRAEQWLERVFETHRQLGILHRVAFCRSRFIGVLTWRGDYARIRARHGAAAQRSPRV
jgi:hypothetical protein